MKGNYRFAGARTFVFSALALLLTCRHCPASDAVDAATSGHGIAAVHVLGLEDVKADAKGQVFFEGADLRFTSPQSSVWIPLRMIESVSVERDTAPLIKGTTGTIVHMAPYGAGRVLGTIRNSVDTVTFVYRDTNQGLHGAVLVVNRGDGDVLAKKIQAQVSTPRQQTPASESKSELPPSSPGESASSTSPNPPAIRVSLVTSSATGVPEAFPVGVYEQLIADLRRSHLFATVYRDGQEMPAQQTAMALQVRIIGFKKGNERTRSIAPFWGSTELKTQVRFEDAHGVVRSDESINAAVHFYHEDLKVDNGLCKKIEKRLQNAMVEDNGHAVQP